MAKRKAGVNDIIYELDNDDIELSSDDEAKQTKMGRFEDEIRKKQRLNAHISEEQEVERYSEVINLDCSSDGPCDKIPPNNNQNGGKTSQTDDNQKSYLKNEITVEVSKKNQEQNDTLIFDDHNIVVDSPSNSDLGVVGCENRTPLVTVRFKDRKFAHTYKKRVREFMINLLRSQSTESDNLSGDSDVELDIWPEELFEEEFDKIEEVSRDLHKDEAIEEFDNVSEVDDSLFFVDTAPCEEAQTDVPKYSQTSSLISDIIEEDISSPTTFRRGPTCFNCDGAHPLKDCKLPRNHNRIAAKRKNMPARVGRYHVEDEQKYGHLVPGRISGNLRHALGLKRYELPLYIYRMRLLGYPPGWLEEARISHSGITLFDSTGNATQDPEEEDGELCEPGSKDKFDIKKILDFPGFNVPASSRYIEEAHLYGLPPMSEQDSKMEMLQMLAPNAMKAYKRKKLTFFPSANQNSLQEGQAEMELDSGDEIAEFPSIPPLPDEEPPPPPPPPPTPPPPPPTEDAPDFSVKSDKGQKTDDTTGKKIDDKNLDAVKEKKYLTSKQTEKGKVNLFKEKAVTVKSKHSLNNEKKDAAKEKANLTNDIKDKVKVTNHDKVLADNEVDLATSSDDELEVIEVMQVPDIPVPEDDLITIDDEDDDLSSGPNSPSLAVLEERKKRLLDALKGDGDISMEMLVLDETFSDSVDDEEIFEIDGKEAEDKGTSETAKEGNNTSGIELEELTAEGDNDSLSGNERQESKAKDGEKSPVKVEFDNIEIKNTIVKTLVANEDKSTEIEKTSTVIEEKNASVEKSSDFNEGDKSLGLSSVLDPDKGQSQDEKDTATKEVSTPDSKAGKVKTTSYGTPVLNVASPFCKLPSDDKFAKNICDVINFENLPNSTGKFKQISSLLKRVKSAVDRIQDS
ncbi:zinc finger CCHC domain-containing protein 8 homolog isoform X2 [Maniola jurtina]|uniref:zinc finger CCHC domain-containing protein 8 homolog isoform X2 n=1 Tax=Maniola jurtina TaxID=191418 RepID=UPI001E68F57D|nr:zinc finger CCHC domain-containing protein 8 homolog isoform X2 [Maniola jurtina]